jgi:hypothetical protein
MSVCAWAMLIGTVGVVLAFVNVLFTTLGEKGHADAASDDKG